MAGSDILPLDDLLHLLQTLVRTPSVNGQHAERAVAEEVAQWASRHGLLAELLGHDTARPNVIVRTRQPGEIGLLLVAHTDTVGPGNLDAWSVPPFSATIRDGRLYGRGAVDNKGGLVAALAALLLLDAAPERLSRPALLIGVPDEESGATGTLGVRYLQAQGRLGGRGAIYTYPGMDTIVAGHRGVLRLTLTAHGTAMHSGSLAWQDAPRGHNALTGLAEVLLALEALRWEERPAPGLFSPYRTVVTPTLIAGGAGPSTVPPSATAQVDIRLVPGVGRERVLAAVQAAVDAVVARRAPLSVELATEVYLPPTEVAPDAAIVTSLRRAAGELLGSTPPLTVSGPANESYLLNGFGIPTCVWGPRGENAHAADEYLEIASIEEAARVYARTAELLSLE